MRVVEQRTINRPAVSGNRRQAAHARPAHHVHQRNVSARSSAVCAVKNLCPQSKPVQRIVLSGVLAQRRHTRRPISSTLPSRSLRRSFATSTRNAVQKCPASRKLLEQSALVSARHLLQTSDLHYWHVQALLLPMRTSPALSPRSSGSVAAM